MILTIVFISLISLGFLLLLFLAFRKLPQIKVVDPGSSREAKTRGVKYDILRKRLERVSGERMESVKRTVSGPFAWVQRSVRRVASRLAAIERSYAERQKGGAKRKANAQELKRMVEEAHELLEAERFDAAEKKLVEVLSIDPKNIDAYEDIGRLYIKTKNIENAKEAFKFLNKLSPQDASVLASLGEISLLEHDADTAFTYFSRAKNISPNNPKYLDFLIETAIQKGDVMEATIALKHLREVNPENKKISVFEERIEEVREKNRKIK